MQYKKYQISKKIALSGLLAFMLTGTAHAAVDTIQVGEPFNAFSPASMTVTLGDTVRFVYASGFHTTTSLSVPDGAGDWDIPMTSPSVFDYVPAVEGSYDYYCVIHGLAMSASFTVSTPLDVRMGRLEGQLTEGNYVQLHWITYSESNNSHFEVQRSDDGLKYETIATVSSLAPEGNSNAMLHYSYTDGSMLQERAFYRLLLKGLDGRISYSNVYAVAVKGSDDIIVKLHPNPAGNTVMIHIQGKINGDAEVQLLDISGKLITRQSLNKDGSDMPVFDLSALASGTYLVKFLDSHQVITTKLTKE